MVHRKLAGIALAAVSVAVFTVGGATSAQAVTCTYNGCSGKDPQAAGCGTGSSTAEEYTFTNKWGKVRIELRHSSSCHTYWVRTTSTNCDEGPYHYHEPLTLGGPVMETGYVDYYGKYHRQGLFKGPKSSVNCGKAEVDWTPMSSDRRERIRYAFLSDDGKTRITSCSDCT